MDNIECNKCQCKFTVSELSVQELSGELQAQEFSCPECRAKYLVLLTDANLRQLIDKRIRLANRQHLAMQKRLKEATLRKYINEIDSLDKKIEQEQKALRETHKDLLCGYENI